MDEDNSRQEIAITAPLRRYYGEDRRRLFAGAYDGIERRIAEPPCEQDEDREPPPN
jgi:hypothetical protein